MLEGVTDDLISTQHVGNLRDTICQAWGYVMGSDAVSKQCVELVPAFRCLCSCAIPSSIRKVSSVAESASSCGCLEHLIMMQGGRVLITRQRACLPVPPLLQDPEAGFFGTTNRVWFFRADRANQAMYVTDAVHCHAVSPSVRQMMYLLLRLKDKPLPTDAIPWEQRDYNRILVEEAGQDSQQGQQACRGQQQGHQARRGQQQGQQACRGQQQGSIGQQGGRQGPVTRLQAKARAASDQQAVAALTSHNIIPFEEFQDRVPIGGGETGTVFAAR